MRAQIEVVSPAMAKEYLERSAPNRRINDSTVTRYADDMRNGRWINNGQTVVFTENGELLDGRHRMSAIVRSGCTISLLVTRGVPAVAMETMDTGRARSLKDVLTLKGYKNVGVLSGAVRLMWNYAAGVSVQYSPSKPTLMAFIEEHPKITLDALAWVESHRQSLIPHAPLVAIMALATESAQLNEEAKKFVDGVCYGEGLYKGDARFTLRRFMESVRAKHEYSGSSVSTPAFGATIKTWNAYAQGNNLEAIRFPPSPTKDNLSIFGYTDKDWTDVPDLRERQAEANRLNMIKMRTSQAERDKLKKLAAEKAQVVREAPPNDAA